MKNTNKIIAAINENGTAFGIGATAEEARAAAIDAGIEPECVNDLEIVTLTPESAAAIEAGDPDAVEIAE